MSKHKNKKAEGGKTSDGEKSKANLYNAKGAPEASEAEDEKAEFKRGGMKKASGGSVLGTKAAVRLDKRARGGAMSSPYSSASKSEEPAKQSSGKGSGHEDEQPSDRVN